MLYCHCCCCCSVIKLCPALCNSMDCSTPGFSVLHYHTVCSNLCPSSWWCHQTISSSVTPFSSCLQAFPASRSFPMSQLFAAGGQSIGASASARPVNIQGWLPLGLAGFIFLLSKGLSRVFNSTIWKHQFFGTQSSSSKIQLSHPYMTTGKTIALTIRTVVSQVMSLFFNMLSRFVTSFLRRSKHLLMLWVQSTSAVILES